MSPANFVCAVHFLRDDDINDGASMGGVDLAEESPQELAQIRQCEANLTALAAIGPRKKCKMGSLASGALAEGSGSAAAQPGGSNGGGGGSRQFTRQRITRVNLRDLLFCLEKERETGHSHLLP
ncbi:hypothetical protein NHX12_017459 [Muraenolepis orangiensis]|uniref:Transcription initiation factor TFIID component TAF4 C-terminal domain-containing protein n=1 Tax=Muraenolepis orangiensis TaxID=630683 RepID=A0A9Q0D826_9TELE|nr:hypothetical protein NHX12_017459 [Muraenolepis orangiensis]